MQVKARLSHHLLCYLFNIHAAVKRKRMYVCPNATVQFVGLVQWLKRRLCSLKYDDFSEMTKTNAALTQPLLQDFGDLRAYTQLFALPSTNGSAQSMPSSNVNIRFPT